LATRFYFQSSGSTAISPTERTSWWLAGKATGFLRRPMAITKQSSTMTTTNFTGLATNDWYVCLQFVCNTPLAAQTITTSATLQGNIRCKVNSGGGSAFASYVFRVMSSDGTTQRGGGGDDGASQITTTLSSRASGAAADLGAAITVTAGDYAVVEIGLDAGSSASNVDFSYGDDSASDLAANTDGTTTADNPWLEISETLTFQSTGAKTLMMMGIGK